MIDYYNGELTDIIPHNFISPETKALSYSMKKALQKLLDYSKACAVYGAIDQVPEMVLDLMAVELNTQYYDENYSVDIKRRLIKQTVSWYMRSGTPSVLVEFLGTLYDGGIIEEWYDYGGNPYYFRIKVSVNEWGVDLKTAKKIRQQIGIYKNQRSWLDLLAYLMQFQFDVKIAYENQIRFQSEAYPRYNLAFHRLEGSHSLDGGKYLNGYDTDLQIDFYPTIQTYKADVDVGEKELVSLQIGADLLNDIDSCGGLAVQGDVAAATEVSTIVRVYAACEADISYANELTVEKNLRYLDGDWFLDGNDLLNADIYTIVL